MLILLATESSAGLCPRCTGGTGSACPFGDVGKGQWVQVSL